MAGHVPSSSSSDSTQSSQTTHVTHSTHSPPGSTHHGTQITQGSHLTNVQLLEQAFQSREKFPINLEWMVDVFEYKHISSLTTHLKRHFKANVHYKRLAHTENKRVWMYYISIKCFVGICEYGRHAKRKEIAQAWLKKAGVKISMKRRRRALLEGANPPSSSSSSSSLSEYSSTSSSSSFTTSSSSSSSEDEGKELVSGEQPSKKRKRRHRHHHRSSLREDETRSQPLVDNTFLASAPSLPHQYFPAHIAMQNFTGSSHHTLLAPPSHDAFRVGGKNIRSIVRPTHKRVTYYDEPSDPNSFPSSSLRYNFQPACLPTTHPFTPCDNKPPIPSTSNPTGVLYSPADNSSDKRMNNTTNNTVCATPIIPTDQQGSSTVTTASSNVLTQSTSLSGEDVNAMHTTAPFNPYLLYTNFTPSNLSTGYIMPNSNINYPHTNQMNPSIPPNYTNYIKTENDNSTLRKPHTKYYNGTPNNFTSTNTNNTTNNTDNNTNNTNSTNNNNIINPTINDSNTITTPNNQTNTNDSTVTDVNNAIPTTNIWNGLYMNMNQPIDPLHYYPSSTTQYDPNLQYLMLRNAHIRTLNQMQSLYAQWPANRYTSSAPPQPTHNTTIPTYPPLFLWQNKPSLNVDDSNNKGVSSGELDDNTSPASNESGDNNYDASESGCSDDENSDLDSDELSDIERSHLRSHNKLDGIQQATDSVSRAKLFSSPPPNLSPINSPCPSPSPTPSLSWSPTRPSSPILPFLDSSSDGSSGGCTSLSAVALAPSGVPVQPFHNNQGLPLAHHEGVLTANASRDRIPNAVAVPLLTQQNMVAPSSSANGQSEYFSIPQGRNFMHGLDEFDTNDFLSIPEGL